MPPIATRVTTLETAQSHSVVRRIFREHRHLLIPLLLLLLYAFQCGWFIRTQSLTCDEPVHIFAGLDAWHNHRFQFWNDHPPLGRMLIALPLIGSRWRVEMSGAGNSVEVRSDAIAVAERARAMNEALGIALGALLWLAVRQLWSRRQSDSDERTLVPAEGAASFALALFAFSPSLLANFSVATTDGVGTLTTFCAALQLLRWRHKPTRTATVLLGLVLGILLLAKFYTPAFFLLTLALMLVLKTGKAIPSPGSTHRSESSGWILRPRQWAWGKAASAAAVALLTLWAGYFFHTSHLTISHDTVVATFPNRPPIIKKAPMRTAVSLWVPAGEYIEGLRHLNFHNRMGHPSYFLGHISKHGSKLYFPVLILLKWPTVVLLLFLATVLLILARKLQGSDDLVVLALYPALMLAMAIMSHIQIGERHILPAYPFVLLIAAGAWEYAHAHGPMWKLQNTRVPVGHVVLFMLVLVNAVDALRYAPDYLAYFNVFVRPTQSWTLASDSNLDWGQGLIALRQYEQQHPGQQVHLAFYGAAKPEWYGVRAVPLNENERVTGTVVVSASYLSGQSLANPQAYHWLLQYPVQAVLDHSLFVFDVPK